MREQDLVERALVSSAGDECIAIASVTHSANLRWANNTLTTNGVTCVRDLTVISLVRSGDGVRAASLTRTGVSGADDVDDVVRACREMADGSRPADDEAPLVSAPVAPDWDDEPAETQVSAFGPLAEGLASAFDAAKSAGEGRFGYAEHSVTTTYVGSSTGLRLRDVLPQGRLELTGRSGDGSRSAWAGTAAREVAGLDVSALDADVARRLAWARRRFELDAGRYETILPPSAVADLVIDLYWTLGALDAHEGSTVFSRPGGGTRVGERLSDLPLTLRSDPSMPGQECTPFVVAGASGRISSVFDNGLPLAPTNWIDDGTLTALLQTRHSADVTGLPVTPVVDNVELVARDATDTVDDLIAGTDRGLLLTCLWYIREVDPQTLLLTGLTRDGVFLVEGGEVVGAVNNFRFNESPVGMLRRLSGVGRSESTFAREFGDYFTRTRMPAVRVADFNMSSVSQAS
jgi:predicted Zn-dependent protease